MPLLGSAAMLLSFDIEAAAVEEHDRWHTHEHLPERLSIPGFCRGTRWIVAEGQPRYMVLYEVESLATLASQAYLARLNNPTPWTTRMMPHYRGMNRGLCAVLGSFGLGLGGIAALIRFAPEPSQSASLNRWLLEEALRAVPQMPGLGSAHLLQGAQSAEMTHEQRIRGADRAVDSAIIVTGYDHNAVAAYAKELCAVGLRDRGAGEPTCATYRWSYSLASAELGADSGAASIQLRQAVRADVAAIADCVAQAYAPWVPRIGREPWPMLQDYDAVVRNEWVTIAEAAGQLVGVLVLSRTEEGLLIENVAAHPNWKGRGVGRALLQHAEQEAHRLGCTNLYLYTNELMVENIALYVKYGYVEYERREEQGFRRVFMRKVV